MFPPYAASPEMEEEMYHIPNTACLLPAKRMVRVHESVPATTGMYVSIIQFDSDIPSYNHVFESFERTFTAAVAFAMFSPHKLYETK